MSVKLVIVNDRDPGICLNLSYVAPGTPGKARGWHGTCTECGKPVHYWEQDKAFILGQKHVDDHETSL